MTASTNAPVPGTGPDATLNFSDPSTWAMILTALAAVAAVVWPGHDIAPLVQGLSVLAASIVAVGVLVAKHHLAAALTAGSALVPMAVSELKAVEGAFAPYTPPAP